MDELLEQVALLVRARFSLLYLLSHEEERVQRALRRLAKREDAPLWRWRCTDGISGPDGELVPDTASPTAALAWLKGHSEPGYFLFLDLHPMLDQAAVVRSLRDAATDLGARKQAVLLLSPKLYVPQELSKDLRIVDVPLPGADEVGRLLKVVLKRQGVTLNDTLHERFVRSSLGLTEKEIKRTYSQILLQGGSFTEDDLSVLARSKQQAIRRSKFLEFYEEVHQMEGVGGLGNLKQWLERRSAAFAESARAFGLPEPKGVFLLGVQGCGKSLTAKAVAGLFRMPLLRLDVGALFAGTGQGAEESLRETIRIAESISPCVLWIDEMEKAFVNDLSASGLSGLGTLLTWMQEKTKPVFVVATANEVRLLPPELLRKGRFDEVFFVDLPNVHERLQILEIHVQNRKRDPDDFDLLQAAEETEKYSGAELEQVVVEALFNAFAENRPLGPRDLIRVVRDTVPLAITMDDRLKELREWARSRCRPASLDRRRVDFFEDFQEA
jgi:ATP-dependent 26S proteasome regulatory subunit